MWTNFLSHQIKKDSFNLCYQLVSKSYQRISSHFGHTSRQFTSTSCITLPQRNMLLISSSKSIKPNQTFSLNPFSISFNNSKISEGIIINHTRSNSFFDVIKRWSSTMKKRRSKMNKHKLKKRRKLMRNKTGRNL